MHELGHTLKFDQRTQIFYGDGGDVWCDVGDVWWWWCVKVVMCYDQRKPLF